MLEGWRGRGVSHSQEADLSGRRQVSFDQHRRHREGARRVVEAALARGLVYKNRSAVDLEGEQVPDRVGVFGPVQPMDGVLCRVGD